MTSSVKCSFTADEDVTMFQRINVARTHRLHMNSSSDADYWNEWLWFACSGHSTAFPTPTCGRILRALTLWSCFSERLRFWDDTYFSPDHLSLRYRSCLTARLMYCSWPFVTSSFFLIVIQFSVNALYRHFFCSDFFRMFCHDVCLLTHVADLSPKHKFRHLRWIASLLSRWSQLPWSHHFAQ